METVNLYGGLDIGNGYVKGVIENQDSGQKDLIDIPAVVSILTRSNQLPVADSDANSVLTNTEANQDFYNNLDASFNSPLVADNYRRVFGVRALTADGAIDQFDTVGGVSKAKQNLSKVLVFGLFAAKALKDYVATVGKLPETELNVNIHTALALPINEYLRFRDSYAAEFTSSSAGHLVTIQNFETKISIRLKFINVQVLAEGASAQYAIVTKGKNLMETMLKDVRAHGMALEGVTADDVLAASNTIGLDIGTGTTQVVVFTNGRFNAEASQTWNKGYGTIMLNTLKAMEDVGFETGFSTRLELAEFLQREPSVLKRAFYNQVQEFTAQETRFFVEEIVEKLGSVLRNVGAVTEVGYVYGGGSGPIKEQLYPALLNKVNNMNSIAFPILYLDAKYSRHLNREGLFIAAKAIKSKR